ncbi:hypothetical protein ABK040_009332 [Willaertia magna]
MERFNYVLGITESAMFKFNTLSENGRIISERFKQETNDISKLSLSSNVLRFAIILLMLISVYIIQLTLSSAFQNIFSIINQLIGIPLRFLQLALIGYSIHLSLQGMASLQEIPAEITPSPPLLPYFPPVKEKTVDEKGLDSSASWVTVKDKSDETTTETEKSDPYESITDSSSSSVDDPRELLLEEEKTLTEICKAEDNKEDSKETKEVKRDSSSSA